MWFLQRRYYCKNVSQCDYALDNYVYDERSYRANKHCCLGEGKDGCGEQLQEGKPVDRRFFAICLVLLISLTLTYITPLVRDAIFPPPLAGITFSSVVSNVLEDEKSVTVIVRRKNDLQKKSFVRFRTEDRTATAGEDYEGDSGQLLFVPGENEQIILIPIIQDSNFREGQETFVVMLPDVEGAPKHRVIISDPPVDQDLLEKADALVRSSSIVATDIAGYIVKHNTLKKLLKSLPVNSSQSAPITSALATNDNNLVNARERYLSLLKDLVRVDHRTVFSALDNWIVSMETRGYTQQKDATTIMKQQLQSMIDTGIIEMDVWVAQLGSVIPKINIDPDNKDPLFGI